MRITFDSSGFTWRRALAVVVILAAAALITVMIILYTLGNTDGGDSAGMALTFLVMIAAPAWIGHVIGRRYTQHAETQRQLEQIHAALQSVTAVADRVDEMADVVARLETAVTGERSVTALRPRGPRS